MHLSIFELKHSKRTGSVIFDNKVNHDLNWPKVDRKWKFYIYLSPENALLNIIGSYIIVSHRGANIYQRVKSCDIFTTDLRLFSYRSIKLMKCISKRSVTGQPELTSFLILTVNDFEHSGCLIDPTSFPAVKWHLKSLKKIKISYVTYKTVKLPWFAGVVDFDFRKCMDFEVWSIFESKGLLFCQSRELKISFYFEFYLWTNYIFSFKESLDTWLSFFTFPDDR